MPLQSAAFHTSPTVLLDRGVAKSNVLTNNNTIANAFSNAAKSINDTWKGYVDNMQIGAQLANSASAAAQAMQYQYNSALQDKQFSFATESAYQANQTSKELQRIAAEYNAAEAEKTRKWQERMSNTAYQRAVADMRAAGINPILAAQNGGANVGSGSTASIGAMSGAQANGSSASVGNYSGQGSSIGSEMAILGTILGLIGNALNGTAADQAKGINSNFLTRMLGIDASKPENIYSANGNLVMPKTIDQKLDFVNVAIDEWRDVQRMKGHLNSKERNQLNNYLETKDYLQQVKDGKTSFNFWQYFKELNGLTNNHFGHSGGGGGHWF